jgi:hypothetical protein
MERATGPANRQRSGDDITWAERYAVMLFIVVTPISYVLSDDPVKAVNSILIINTLITLAAWGVFRGFEFLRTRRPRAATARATVRLANGRW